MVIVLALLSFVLLREWYIVGYVADPAVLAAYRFGAEGPAAGAVNYANPAVYARTAAIGGLASTALLSVSLVAGWLRSRGLLAASFLLTAAIWAWSLAGAA
ncbi:hypothetical protein [Rubrivivax albus]|uniref:Uncharacterized protein n=1 Tax=Rubrivivax albus TaxID=2499835 RepID=A0A3S2VSH3_9BURK|nr:hypothetical protein [Rubrivivax albus]RVT47474.1 hypothetical protein ENE75_24010 [Rubrivivax albus]